jgi:hypothetical protein
VVKVGKGAGEVFVLATEGDEFGEVGVWDPVFFGHGEVWLGVVRDGGGFEEERVVR